MPKAGHRFTGGRSGPDPDAEPESRTVSGIPRPGGSEVALSIHELLDMSTIEATPERVVLSLPITWRVHQPSGILHGGVSALLAESAASWGAALNAGADKVVVGVELNASHLRAVREGTLIATATPVRVGRTLQVWDIALTDGGGRDICRCRCTLAIRDSAPAAATGPSQPAS